MQLGLGQDDEDDGGVGGDCHSDGCVIVVMRVSLVQWIWVTGQCSVLPFYEQLRLSQQWVVLSECGGSYKHKSLFLIHILTTGYY